MARRSTWVTHISPTLRRHPLPPPPARLGSVLIWAPWKKSSLASLLGSFLTVFKHLPGSPALSCVHSLPQPFRSFTVKRRFLCCYIYDNKASHPPWLSLLCFPYCSSTLWDLAALYTLPRPCRDASGTTTSVQLWRLRRQKRRREHGGNQRRRPTTWTARAMQGLATSGFRHFGLV